MAVTVHVTSRRASVLLIKISARGCLIRFVSLMKTLYATAVVVGSAIFPGLNVHRQYAYFVNLIYGGAAILNFLSCLV